MVGHFDERIAAHLGRVAGAGTRVAIAGFGLAVVTAAL